MPFELRVRGGAPIPAGKIVCIGKNYEDHRKEMAGALGSGAAGDQRPPEDPVIFLKPASCLVHDGGEVVIPPGVANVHWETELAVVVGRPISRATPDAEVMRAVLGYAVFLDMTARDLQAEAKRAGTPWTLSKAMDTFGPVSEVVPAAQAPAWDAMELELKVNGEVRQKGATREMIHGVPKILRHASRYVTLEPGDLVATGTPAGVAACKPGDALEASLVGVARLRVRVVAG
jgi:2-keto-4-pentenoate hydratase/2-oxohepta-3-ene-1,7-dioic acid hydratase in catechol pathway